MSDGNRRRDTQYDNIAELLRQRDHELLLQVHTMVPGIIQSYNARKRRCSVKPALRTVWRDGQILPRKVLHNVQVVWPRGHNTSIHFALEKGDEVQILFSERGLEEWRRTHKEATPDATGWFSEKDAVVQAGFGAVAEIEALEGDGVFQRRRRGERRVVIDSDSVMTSWWLNTRIPSPRSSRTSIDIESPDGAGHSDRRPGTSTATIDRDDLSASVTGAINACRRTSDITLTTPAGTLIHLNAAHVQHSGTEIDSHHDHDPYTTPQHAAGTCSYRTAFSSSGVWWRASGTLRVTWDDNGKPVAVPWAGRPSGGRPPGLPHTGAVNRNPAHSGTRGKWL